jgi:hypothetical protein
MLYSNAHLHLVHRNYLWIYVTRRAQAKFCGTEGSSVASVFRRSKDHIPTRRSAILTNNCRVFLSTSTKISKVYRNSNYTTTLSFCSLCNTLFFNHPIIWCYVTSTTDSVTKKVQPKGFQHVNWQDYTCRDPICTIYIYTSILSSYWILDSCNKFYENRVTGISNDFFTLESSQLQVRTQTDRNAATRALREYKSALSLLLGGNEVMQFSDPRSVLRYLHSSSKICLTGKYSISERVPF